MRLDLLPAQPEVDSEVKKRENVRPAVEPETGHVDLTALPNQPEPVDFEELDKVVRDKEGEAVTLGGVGEITVAPETTGIEIPIPPIEEFEKRIELFAGRLIPSIYGEEKAKEFIENEKQLEFFMSRAPRIALAFAAPLYSVAYEVLDQGKNFLVASLKDERYSPFDRRILSELLPEDTPTALKVASSLAETLADIALVGAAMNMAKQGTLIQTIKEIGIKLEAAGHGADKITIPKEAIIEAAKKTNLWNAVKAFVKAKNISVRPVPPGTTTSPITGRDIKVVGISGVARKPPTPTPSPPVAKPKFKKPTPFKLITSQSRYAELLGLKEGVEPLEIGKMAMDKEILILNRQIDQVVKKLKSFKTLSPEAMAVVLNTNLTAPKEFTDKEKEVFDYFRSLTKELLARQNQVRAELDLDPIEDIGAYFRHMATDQAKAILEGSQPMPEKLKKWAGENFSDKVYNPMERQRKIEDKLLSYFNDDLAFVMKAMVRTALKEIHLSKPLVFLKEYLASSQKDPTIRDTLSPADKKAFDAVEEMPEATRKWLVDYVNNTIIGQQTSLDESVNLLVSEGAVGKILDKILTPFGKSLGDQALTNLISGISQLPLFGVMGPFNPRQLLRNKFQILQNLALYGINATSKGFFLANINYPVLKQLKTDSIFLDMYSGIEGMPVSAVGKVKQAHFALWQGSAVSNVSQTMNAAYHWVSNLIQNPQNTETGWADPQRDYTEDKDFFYPSELVRIKKEMEYGAHTAQYAYLGLYMPEIFRYKALAGFTRLNSWWMNHWAVFHREASTRAFAGHTGYDSTLRIPVKSRWNYLKYLAIAGFVLNTMGYERSFFLGTAPSGLPPVAQIASGVYRWTIADPNTDHGKRQRAQASKDIANAAKTFIPGYLTIKDISALLTGEKPWTDYFFYNKVKKRKIFKP